MCLVAQEASCVLEVCKAVENGSYRICISSACHNKIICKDYVNQIECFASRVKLKLTPFGKSATFYLGYSLFMAVAIMLGFGPEIWEDLFERFSHSDAPRMFQLHKDIVTLVQGTDSVAEYFTKLKGLWDSYLIMVSLPNCKCVSGQKDCSTRAPLVSESSALASVQHIKPVFGTTLSGKKSKFFCQHCKIYGHTIDRCFKIHGYPKNSKGNNSFNQSKRVAGNAFSEECVETGTITSSNSSVHSEHLNTDQHMSLTSSHKETFHDAGQLETNLCLVFSLLTWLAVIIWQDPVKRTSMMVGKESAGLYFVDQHSPPTAHASFISPF
ncbi:unnamed protein product [Cuscuta campestris]|uniref:Retrotransposon gag domain-containing protein n=1 Tax=Cuscuta campestris TaxID=132261 RepID=A0A484N1P1_9ASTE|nr:unnamed protein product [Cuscuta campestris]